MGTSSPTDALDEVYKNYDERLQLMLEGLEPLPQQVGVAGFINNRFSCLDLFDRPPTLQKVWQKLIKSYAMEAVEVGKKPKARCKPDPRTVFDAVTEGICGTFPSVGMGTDLRLHGPGIIGADLALDSRILHLSVFAAGPETSSRAHAENRMERPGRRRRNLE